MSDAGLLAVIAAAMTPVSWIASLFYHEGKHSFPGAGLPPTGFGLLSLFAIVQCVGIAVACSLSARHPEIRELSLTLLVISLIAMFGFSVFSRVFANSQFARRGVWHGLVGLLLLLIAMMVS